MSYQPPARSRLRRVLRTVGFTLALAVVGLSAAVAGFAIVQHKSPWQVVTEPIVPDPQALFGKSQLRVLVVGLDYDYTNNDLEYSTNSRSDIIMAVNLDFKNHRVYELSVPRDMVATLPNGQEAKINQAQSDGGIAESEAVVSKWLGIPGFDRYVVLRIDTTKDLIDAIGGVDVDVKNSDALMHEGPNGPINYDDNWGHLHVHLAPGLQHLSGAQAVGYARFRHDWCSDPCRIMRQQQVVKAIVNKLKANKLDTLLHLRALLAVVNHDVQTNFTTTEELSIASAFAGITPKDIHTAQVPYVADVNLPGYGDSILPDTVKRAQLVRDMLLDPPQPIPSPDAAAVASLDAASVRVDVENGAGVPGAAQRVADLLRAKGFTIGSVGDAATFDHARTEIREHSPTALAAFKVRQALGIRTAHVVALDAADQGAAHRVVLVVGRDLAAQ